MRRWQHTSIMRAHRTKARSSDGSIPCRLHSRPASPTRSKLRTLLGLLAGAAPRAVVGVIRVVALALLLLLPLLLCSVLLLVVLVRVVVLLWVLGRLQVRAGRGGRGWEGGAAGGGGAAAAAAATARERAGRSAGAITARRDAADGLAAAGGPHRAPQVILTSRRAIASSSAGVPISGTVHKQPVRRQAGQAGSSARRSALVRLPAAAALRTLLAGLRCGPQAESRTASC